ncbi:MAG: hypothetical protein IKU34_00455 [Clostridia bacterium]|nr:hypothetical protein [Clostridia bacterium]
MKKFLEEFLKLIGCTMENGKQDKRAEQKSDEAEKKPVRKPLFVAAGKEYYSEKQLTMLRVHLLENIYRDCYGRRVLLIDERYPTFDSYDALYEDRYYHHYYIETPEGFTHVRTADDQPEIPVWEGIKAEDFIWNNKTWHSSLLKAAGLIRDEEK